MATITDELYFWIHILNGWPSKLLFYISQSLSIGSPNANHGIRNAVNKVGHEQAKITLSFSNKGASVVALKLKLEFASQNNQYNDIIPTFEKQR